MEQTQTMALTLDTQLQARGPAAAIVLTDDQVAALSSARAFPVTVTIDGHTVRLRLARMGGENLIGMSRAVRAELGVEAGQQVRAEIAPDEESREVDLPAELTAALAQDPALQQAWQALAPSRRKEHVRQLTEAKQEATRQRRLAAIVDSLRG